MEQGTFSVRMNESLKKKADPVDIASSSDEITREGAMQAFMDLRNQAKANGVSDMSLEEINKEIYSNT